VILDSIAEAGFPNEDRALVARAAAIIESGGAAAPRNIDLATAIAFLRVSLGEQNAAFARKVGVMAVVAKAIGPRPRDVVVGIVPGAFYLEHANTGADGARILRILEGLGIEASVIPVQSFGSLADNAGIILHWLRERSSKPVVLISLSKGASDLKFALQQLGPDHGDIRIEAWISLSGISTGTPLVRWLRRRPWRWAGVWLLLQLRGQRIAVLRELDRGPGTPLSAWPPTPPHMQIVHVHGFPLERHLAHPWARRAWRRLAPLGPNDGGGVLLSDVAQWPGVVVPLWGIDHYMQPHHDITARLSQVFQAVLNRPI
jgi:hypothetical protein